MSQLVPTESSFERWIDIRIRRQLLRDGDWRGMIQRSELPQQVQQLIAILVVKTGLMRFEKVEVAHELIAHFQDGHQRGESFSTLVEVFGDPAVAAKLIKNSKQRNRPMFVKIMKASGLLVGGMILAYLVMMFIFNSASPNPSTDYLAVFNKPVTDVDPEQQAWPMYYRDAYRKYGLAEGGGEKFEELFVDDPVDGGTRLVRPDDPEWDQAVVKLEQLADVLDIVREGSRLPSLGVELQINRFDYDRADFEAIFPEVDYDRPSNDSSFDSYKVAGISPEASELLDGSVVNILLPHVQSFRTLARVLQVDTRLAAQQQDADRVVENARATLGLSKQVAETPCLVGSLVGYAVANLGFANIEEVLIDHPDLLDDQQLEKLQGHVEAIDISSYVNFSGEKAMVEDFIQRIYSDDGNGDGRLTAVGLEVMESFNKMNNSSFRQQADDGVFNSALAHQLGRGLIGPITLFSAASRGDVQQQSDRFFEQVSESFDLPYWMEGNLDQVKLPEAQVLRMLTPAYQQVKQATERTITYRHATALAIAIHRYHLANDRWPESMEDLLDGWIAEAPIDRFTGDPLKFKIDEFGKLTIYGAGPDGDDDGGIDDSGAIPFALLKQPVDGDWIYWPLDRKTR